jgi:hypothetical protein
MISMQDRYENRYKRNWRYEKQTEPAGISGIANNVIQTQEGEIARGPLRGAGISDSHHMRKVHMNRTMLQAAGRRVESRVMEQQEKAASAPKIPEGIVPKIKNIIYGVIGLNTEYIYERGEESAMNLGEGETNLPTECANYASLFEKTNKEFNQVLNHLSSNLYTNLLDSFDKCINLVDESTVKMDEGEMMARKYGRYEVPLVQTGFKKTVGASMNAFERLEMIKKMNDELSLKKTTPKKSVLNLKDKANTKLMYGHSTDTT